MQSKQKELGSTTRVHFKFSQASELPTWVRLLLSKDNPAKGWQP